MPTSMYGNSVSTEVGWFTQLADYNAPGHEIASCRTCEFLETSMRLRMSRDECLARPSCPLNIPTLNYSAHKVSETATKRKSAKKKQAVELHLRGLKKREIAERIGVSERQVYRFLSGFQAMP